MVPNILYPLILTYPTPVAHRNTNYTSSVRLSNVISFSSVWSLKRICTRNSFRAVCEIWPTFCVDGAWNRATNTHSAAKGDTEECFLGTPLWTSLECASKSFRFCREGCMQWPLGSDRHICDTEWQAPSIGVWKLNSFIQKNYRYMD